MNPVESWFESAVDSGRECRGIKAVPSPVMYFESRLTTCIPTIYPQTTNCTLQSGRCKSKGKTTLAESNIPKKDEDRGPIGKSGKEAQAPLTGDWIVPATVDL